MNVLFLTLLDIKSIENRGIYEDLLREFRKNGHEIYVASPSEKRNRLHTHVIDGDHCRILKVRTGNIQKTNILEKGIATILLESQFVGAISTFFADVKFDLVLYSTPPITLAGAIKYVKERDNASTYLLLKDIFPQNAVDLGMMSPEGLKAPLYHFFRKKEKLLYTLSDAIGCMSQANVDYVIKHNDYIDPQKVEVCPNSVDPVDMSVSAAEKAAMRQKYELPQDKLILVYGGNLGKPQDIPFIIKCLESQKDNDELFFLIVGDGTEYDKLEAYTKSSDQANLKLMKRLPKDDYDKLVGSCDVGMIFLDYRFTIPNFPSRLLSYMQAKIPTLAVTDENTDIGKILADSNSGWWCKSNSVEEFCKCLDIIKTADLAQMGQNGWDFMVDNYGVEMGYGMVVKNK